MRAREGVVIAHSLLLSLLCACGGGGEDVGGGGGGTPAQPVELLQNAGCEAPALPDGTLARVTPTSWSGGAALTNPSAAGGVAANVFTWPQPAEGQQYCDIGNVPGTRMSQSFTVVTAGTYRIAWEDNTGLNIVAGFRTSPYTLALTDATGRQVYAASFDAYRPTGAWEARTIDQVLAAGAYTLAFASQGSTGNGTDTLIDEITLRAVP